MIVESNGESTAKKKYKNAVLHYIHKVQHKSWHEHELFLFFSLFYSLLVKGKSSGFVKYNRIVVSICTSIAFHRIYVLCIMNTIFVVIVLVFNDVEHTSLWKKKIENEKLGISWKEKNANSMALELLLEQCNFKFYPGHKYKWIIYSEFLSNFFPFFFCFPFNGFLFKIDISFCIEQIDDDRKNRCYSDNKLSVLWLELHTSKYSIAKC